jgi:hypothetical protein
MSRARDQRPPAKAGRQVEKNLLYFEHQAGKDSEAAGYLQAGDLSPNPYLTS